jgi:hypothetical protein
VVAFVPTLSAPAANSDLLVRLLNLRVAAANDPISVFTVTRRDQCELTRETGVVLESGDGSVVAIGRVFVGGDEHLHGDRGQGRACPG